MKKMIFALVLLVSVAFTTGAMASYVHWQSFYPEGAIVIPDSDGVSTNFILGTDIGLDLKQSDKTKKIITPSGFPTDGKVFIDFDMLTFGGFDRFSVSTIPSGGGGSNEIFSFMEEDLGCLQKISESLTISVLGGSQMNMALITDKNWPSLVKGNVRFESNIVAALVSEPTSILLLGTGLMGLVGMARWKKRNLKD